LKIAASQGTLADGIWIRHGVSRWAWPTGSLSSDRGYVSRQHRI